MCAEGVVCVCVGREGGGRKCVRVGREGGGRKCVRVGRGGGGRKCVFCTREYDSFVLIYIISFISQKAKLLVAELMDQKEMEVSGLDSLSFTPTNVILLTFIQARGMTTSGGRVVEVTL